MNIPVVGKAQRISASTGHDAGFEVPAELETNSTLFPSIYLRPRQAEILFGIIRNFKGSFKGTLDNEYFRFSNQIFFIFDWIDKIG